MNSLYSIAVVLAKGQLNKEVYATIKAHKTAQAAYLACNSDTLKKAEEILNECKERKISTISFYDENYPKYLREIHSPPAVLFVKGELPDLWKTPSITMVGTRNCSEDGKQNALRFAYALALVGFTVVSGLALGIDTFSHKGCLLSSCSKTVAVLAGGVDCIYPAENKNLYEYIIDGHGAVISELLPKTPPLPRYFPIRNRILSGLTPGTLVVEAGEKGGSLITAAAALEQNRTVFAIPGSVRSKHCKGTNDLIRSGAVFCNGISVIVEDYYPIYGDKIKVIDVEERKQEIEKKKEAKTSKLNRLSKEQIEIYKALEQSNKTADELCDMLDIPIVNILIELQCLEFGGFIVSLPGGFYKVE